jgi:hypothetical protein
MTDRPLDPNDLLAPAIAAASGCPLEVAQREADAIREVLTENGAFLSYGVGLPESVPAGDPRTAASEIDNVSPRSWAVWHTLVVAGEPLSTEELNDRYQQYAARMPGVYPPMAWDSPRKRLSELARAGHVTQVLKDGKPELRKNRNNASCTVWRAAGGPQVQSGRAREVEAA